MNFTRGKILLSHFWYTNFWVPDPPFPPPPFLIPPPPSPHHFSAQSVCTAPSFFANAVPQVHGPRPHAQAVLAEAKKKAAETEELLLMRRQDLKQAEAAAAGKDAMNIGQVILLTELEDLIVQDRRGKLAEVCDDATGVRCGFAVGQRVRGKGAPRTV